MPGFFPIWMIVTHFLNIFFLLLMARSGLEVLSAFPKLYVRDDCSPGREWLRFSRKHFSADSRRLWSSLNEEESWSPVLALPGRKNLSLGRHWHFMTVPFWICTGAVPAAEQAREPREPSDHGRRHRRPGEDLERREPGRRRRLTAVVPRWLRVSARRRPARRG